MRQELDLLERFLSALPERSGPRAQLKGPSPGDGDGTSEFLLVSRAKVVTLPTKTRRSPTKMVTLPRKKRDPTRTHGDCTLNN